MGFLGLGTGELIVIAVVALIIFGPGKLPEVAGQVGKALRDFRKMTGDLSGEFEKTAGLEDIKRSVQREIAGVQNEVNSVTKGVKKDLTGTAKTPAKPAAKTGTAGAAKPAAAGAKTATATARTTTTGIKAGINNTAKKADDAAEEPIAPKAPSKADPFADLIAIDAGSAPASAPVKVVAAKSAPAAPAVDHLAQVRARRMSPAGDRTSTSA